MIRELILFELRLGSETDRFKARLRDVQASMRRLGVEPGRNWWNVTGQARWLVVEREFPSMAAYEKDDQAFHGDDEFMTQWRAMEECAASMRVELWQGGASGD
jgi:hypothetical protein